MGREAGVAAFPRQEARETAATTTGLIVTYVRRHGGVAAVDALLSTAEVPFTAAELSDASRWFSYATRIRLFEAATEVLGDPATAFNIGATALDSGLSPAVVLVIRAVGSPRRVYRQLPPAVAKFSTTSTMEILDSGACHATIRYRLHDGYVHSRLDCDYARGLISTVPAMFGQRPARVQHPACESDGYDACLYRVTWQRRPRLLHRLRSTHTHDAELRALRGQLEALQSAASELVAEDDPERTLARITERAASAVVAPAYAIAVHGADGTPLVHTSGLDDIAGPRVAEQLLTGEDLGPHAVVVDVATNRRVYGRLAALHDERQRAFGDESRLLQAYAAYAAAALEKLTALEASRRDAARSRDLLHLAHRLAAARQEQEVADVVVDATPAIVGAPRASVLGWDAGTGSVRVLAAHGTAPDEYSALMSSFLEAKATPELARMVTDATPVVLRRASASLQLRAMLEAVGSDVVVAAPLHAADRLLGIITASHGMTPPPLWPDADAVARLRGVADQTAAAFHNAHLLARVHHQANHDPLTELPNRAHFRRQLDERLRTASDDAAVAVLFCDLDGFKDVNDRLGHAAGDELLQEVAGRLRGVVRERDLVARLSGDEFAVIVRGHGVASVAAELGHRITRQLGETYELDGRSVDLSVSVGVAVNQDAGRDGDHLLQRADAAMYLAKDRGRDQVAYDHECGAR